MGKDFEMPPGWEHVGRFWGIIGRADLPLSACETFVEPSPVMIRFRRIVRRFLRTKGLTRRGRGAVRLFTEQHWQWARVLNFASRNPLASLEEVKEDWVKAVTTEFHRRQPKNASGKFIPVTAAAKSSGERIQVV